MLEIIGEAAYKLTNEFKEDNPDLPWRKMVGMRHVLVHGYNNVSPEVLSIMGGDSVQCRCHFGALSFVVCRKGTGAGWIKDSRQAAPTPGVA